MVAIADLRLTERQKQGLINRDCSLSVARALKRKGLSLGMIGTGMSWSCEPILSGLGERVRRTLLSLPTNAKETERHG